MTTQWSALFLVLVSVPLMPAVVAQNTDAVPTSIVIVEDWRREMQDDEGNLLDAYIAGDRVTGSVRVMPNRYWIAAEVRFEATNWIGDPVNLTWIVGSNTTDLRFDGQSITTASNDLGLTSFEVIFPGQPALMISNVSSLTIDDLRRFSHPDTGSLFYPLVISAYYDGTAEYGPSSVTGFAAPAPGPEDEGVWCLCLPYQRPWFGTELGAFVVGVVHLVVILIGVRMRLVPGTDVPELGCSATVLVDQGQYIRVYSI